MFKVSLESFCALASKLLLTRKHLGSKIDLNWGSLTLEKHKWGYFDLAAFNVIREGYLVHLSYVTMCLVLLLSVSRYRAERQGSWASCCLSK